MLPFSLRMAALRRTLLALVAASLATAASGADITGEIAAVERIRGLKFTGTVNTVEIDRRDLPAHLREQFAKSLPYSVQEWGDVLRALRLIGKENDEAIVSSLLDLYQQQVLAYYDPPSKTFYMVRQMPDAMKGLPMTGLDAGVRVHELTHALQDQHFAIGARDFALRDDADTGLAWHALIEGEASLVMLAYMVEKSGGSFDEMIKNDLFAGTLSAAASQPMPVGAPPYFVEMLKFPYVDGLRFVIEAYRRGGWKELDRVYANPPRSTREILHPADYYARRAKPGPPVILMPHFSPRLLSVEHLGEWHWRFLVGARNAEGWEADTVTIAQNRFCEPTVLVDTTWDTEEQARRFFDAYTKKLDSEGVGTLSKISGTSVLVAYGADRPLMESFLTP
jgi:hypothetical protein